MSLKPLPPPVLPRDTFLLVTRRQSGQRPAVMLAKVIGYHVPSKRAWRDTTKGFKVRWWNKAGCRWNKVPGVVGEHEDIDTRVSQMAVELIQRKSRGCRRI